MSSIRNSPTKYVYEVKVFYFVKLRKGMNEKTIGISCSIKRRFEKRRAT